MSKEVEKSHKVSKDVEKIDKCPRKLRKLKNVEGNQKMEGINGSRNKSKC